MLYTKFQDIPPFTRTPTYYVNQSWKYMPEWISDQDELELDPDFQRAHVWTQDQQIKYVEFRLRGGSSGRDLYFNHPGWMGNFTGRFVLVDGKQRLQAALKFMNNEIPAFGTLYKDYIDKIRLSTVDFIVHVNDLKTDKEVLQWYIDLNAGGTPHTESEISKVKDMINLLE